LLDYFFLAVTSFFAGAINSVAGGGTLLTFPALFAVLLATGEATAGEVAVIANATSTAALAPGALAGAWGYRAEIRRLPGWAFWLLAPGLVGGLLGALLLVALPADTFRVLVPWLILTAAILFSLQPQLTRWSLAKAAAAERTAALAAQRAAAEPAAASHEATGHEAASAGAAAPAQDGPRHFVAVMVMQLFVSTYGGYFGAGMGILMLAGLGFMGLKDIHEMNALKNLLGSLINGVAIVVFAAKHEIRWPIALLMAVAAIAGGYAGASVARRLNRTFVRHLVVAIGFCLASYYFYNLLFGG